MNIVLWVLQILIAAFFLLHGGLYISMTAKVAEINGLPSAFVVFIGVAELLGAAGLILPGVTRILLWFTSLAAAGLMIVTVSATVFHLSRGEIANAPLPAILSVLLAFVAYVRWGIRPLLQQKTA